MEERRARRDISGTVDKYSTTRGQFSNALDGQRVHGQRLAHRQHATAGIST